MRKPLFVNAFVRKWVAVGTAVLLAPLLSTVASTGGAGASTSGLTASAPGITPKTIKIGLITSVTGNASSTFFNSGQGAQARFDLQNARGGVDGRKLQLIVVDDQSTPGGDLTAAQELVSAKGVFAVIQYSPYGFGSYRYLQQQGVPVTGSAFDGPEWGQQPNTNMFSIGGGVDPHNPANTETGVFFKSLGVKNVAGLAYGISPSSIASIKDLKESVEHEGMTMGYENLSVPFGGVDFTADVLQMKSAGVDAAVCSCVQSSNIALIVAAKQAGLHLKAELSLSGADSSLFDSPTSTAAAQGAYFGTTIVPIDLHRAPTNTFVAAMRKYVPGYTGGYPSFGLTGAYLSADLMIKGLEVAGKNPTRASFIKNLTKVKNYNAGGLLPNTVGFNHFGKANPVLCGYITRVVGTQFVTINHGKPFCGKLIPNSDVS
ncbi:MAG TPA: ABC transporter substrate-binding protein [Acidimicrobiales bacterium]|nr:ABC transporter substrate-binding protein [Acidimicrobiales bacterium]